MRIIALCVLKTMCGLNEWCFVTRSNQRKRKRKRECLTCESEIKRVNEKSKGVPLYLIICYLDWCLCVCCAECVCVAIEQNQND